MRKARISNSQDVIDSRDVIARIEELEAEREAAQEEGKDALGIWEEDSGDELEALKALAEEGEANSPNWKHGETLIRESYFETYAREFADDIGAIDRNAHWPLCHIDWEAAAESLKMDYSDVDYDGVTYLVR